MSSNNVDNRVVNMQFNNEQFEAGVKQTLSSLEELKESLKFNTSLTGINAISNAISTFSIANISDQIETLTDRFSTLGIVGMTAIQNITNKVMDFATSKVSSTLGQITSGGWSRASSIAQSRFTLEGLFEGDMDKVTAAFDSASEAVDNTAYSLDSAVSAASQLAASGVEVGDEMTNTLKGIAGTAAMTGDSFDSIANIFTTVAGNGRLMGMQLTQLSSHGLNAAATIADYLGTTEAEVRDMVSDGEISFETFSNAMQSAFGEHAKDANKTFSGSMDNIKSALSRIGAIFSSGIIENDDLIETLNDVRKTINNIKEAMLPLEDTFKNMVSAVSKLASSLLKGLDLSGIDKFVEYVGIGMEYITDITTRWANWNEALRLSVLGDVADDAEKVSDAIHATSEEIKLAEEVWYKGLHGVGQARKDEITEMGEDYDTVQYLINQLAAGVTDLSEVDVAAVKETTDAVDGMADATENAAEQQERATIPIIRIVKSFQTFGEGVDIIFHNIKTTVLTLGKTFKKVFSWKKFYTDIEDYGKLFSEFMGNFGLTEERAGKLETALTGLWSAIDLVRKAIKLLVTAGVKILGPVLSVLFDIILDVTSAIGSAITKINEWSDEHSFLTDAISWFGETLASVISTIKEFFTELWNLPAVQQIKDNLIELGEYIIEKLSPYFEEAAGKIKDFFDSFNDGDDSTMQKVLDNINGALETLIQYSGDAKNGIGDFIGSITGGIGDILGFNEDVEDTSKKINKVEDASKSLVKSNSMGEFLDNLGNLVSNFGLNVDKVISWVIKKFNSIDGSTVALVGFGSGITALGLSLSYLNFNVGNLVKSISMVPQEIAGTIKSFKGVFEGIKTYLKNKSQAEVIKAFAIAIAVMAASLIALTFVDQSKLETAWMAMASLLTIMTLAVTVISQTSKKMASSKTFFKTMSAMAVMFVAIAAAALILVVALKELTKLNWDKSIIGPCIALVAILGALVGLAVLFNKVGGTFSSSAVNVLLLSASLWLVAKAMTQLNNLETDGLAAKVGALIGVLATLGVAAALMSKFGITNAIGLLTLIGSILLIEIGLRAIILFGVSMDDILDHLDKFTPILVSLGVIAAFMVAVGIACKKASNVAVNILAMAVSILILVKAIKYIGEQDIGTITKGVIAVLLLIKALQQVMVSLGNMKKDINKGGTTLIKMAVAVGLLAVIVGLIGKVPLPELAKGLGVVALLITMVTLFAIFTSNVKGMDFKALYAMVVAVGVIAIIVALFAKIKDKTALLEAAGILGVALLGLGVSLYLASRWANKLKTSALVTMVVALIAIAGSLYLLANYTKKQSMLITAASCMAGVLIALGVTFAIFGKTFNSLGTKSLTKNGRLTAMILMIAMLAAVATALYFLSQNSSTGILYAALAIIGVMAVVLYSISQFLKTLSTLKIDGNAIKGLVAAIALLAVTAGSLALLVKAGENSDWTQILASAMAISIVMVVVVGLMQYINQVSGQFNLSTLGAVISACALLLVVSYSLKQLLGTGADWQQMIAAAGAMSLAIIGVSIAIGALIALTSAFGGVGVAAALVILLGLSAVLLSLAAAFTAFGKASKNVVSALQQLTKVDFEVLKANLGTLWQLVAIAGALSIISVVLGAGLVSIGIGLAAVGIGAIPVVAGIALVGVTIAAVSKVVTELITAFDHLVTTFSESNGSIKSGITEIGSGLAGAITGFVTTLAVQTPIIKTALLTILNAAIDIVVDGITTINSKILDGLITLLSDLEEKLPEINEKINNIITETLQSIANNATTYGYYGAVIAISFLYGISQGLVEYSDELGQTVANVIIALFNMMGELIDVLMPALTDGIKKGVLNLSEALWGVLAETGWDYAEENYQTVLGEQEQVAAEQSEKLGEITDKYYAKGVDDNSDQVENATGNVVANATDQSDVAKSGAETTGNAYSGSLLGSLTSGFDSSSVGDKIGSYFNLDLSGEGSTSALSYITGANETLETETMDVSHLPTQAIEDLEEQGWKLEDGGKTMTRSIQAGVDDSTIDLTTNWDDSETALYDAADDTAEGMEEKGQSAGEYYGDGIVTGLDNKISDIKAKAEEVADAIDGTVTGKDGLDENSPSKKAISAGQYYGMGLGNGLSNMTNYVKSAATSLARQTILAVGDMMATISDIMSDDTVDWNPTITPVIDSSNIQNGINTLGNVGTNSLAMAADASISVNNMSQNSLANQVQALSEQVQKLADTDYSKLLEGVNINVDASTNVDGTPLKRMSSAFTIQQIDDTQNGLIMAAGGRV